MEERIRWSLFFEFAIESEREAPNMRKIIYIFLLKKDLSVFF